MNDSHIYQPSLLPPRFSQSKSYGSNAPSRRSSLASMLRSGATTILYSKKYVTLYFLVVFLNYFLLMWFILGIVSDLGNDIDGGSIVFALEIVATILLALEDILHVLSIGSLRNFIGHQSNVYDTIVVILSVILLIFTRIPECIKDGYYKEVFKSITICFRIIVHQLRLIAVIKNQYRNYNSQTRVGLNVGTIPKVSPKKSKSPVHSSPSPSFSSSPYLKGSRNSSAKYGSPDHYSDIDFDDVDVDEDYNATGSFVYRDNDALLPNKGRYDSQSADISTETEYEDAESIFVDSDDDDDVIDSDDTVSIIKQKK